MPAVEAEYGIEAVTGRIDDLYERLGGAAPQRRLRRRPLTAQPAGARPEAAAGAALPASGQETPAAAGPRGTAGAGSDTSPAAQKVGAQ